MLRIPILTYHSIRGHWLEYEKNDHLALEEDLRLIARLGFAVIPLNVIARHIAGEVDLASDLKVVGLTFDDGPHWDWYDFTYPGAPFLKGMRRILLEAGECFVVSGMPRPSAVSFVIASADARHQIDERCIAGRGDWSDNWWREAAAGSTIGVGNHSWDHLHVVLDHVAQREQRKGSFHAIDSFPDADVQIRKAEEYIAKVTGGRSARLFAYPYGQVPEYVATEYLPRHQNRHKQRAAFTTAGSHACRGVSRWRIPRYTFADHWKAPGELEAILKESCRIVV